MKGKFKVIVITLVLLLIGTGALLWKINDMSQKITEREQANLKEERDLLEEQKGKAIDETKQVDITPLYLSGDKKNVVTTQFDSVKEVYSEAKSAEVEENLTNIKKNKIFTLDDALWAYNPYGTNRNSLYVYFKSNGNCYCRYTVSVKDEKIPDFTRTAHSSSSRNVTKEHEYQLIGLVAGQTNYITMRLYNSDDKLSEVRTFSITIPKSRMGVSNFLKIEKGRSKTAISNGLYVVFQDGKKVSGSGKKSVKKYGILMYDNSGILRTEIPTDGYIGRNIEQVYDTLLFASSAAGLSQVNALGQVVKLLPLNGCRLSGEFTYDGYGNAFLIVTEQRKKAVPRSKIVKLELETGKIIEMVNMNELLPKVYQNAVKKSGKQGVDWVGLNSVKVVDSNSLLLSAKKLSSVFKVSGIGSLMTKVDYIIADKKRYEPYKSLRKKVLTKSAGEDAEAEPEETPTVNSILKKPVKKEPFVSQYGQEALDFQARKTEGQSTVSMLSSNAGSSAFYRYLVDEIAGTYELKETQKLEKTQQDGNVIKKKDSFLYCCSDKKSYMEADQTGKLIRKFFTGQRPYRVYKNDFKGFWFH